MWLITFQPESINKQRKRVNNLALQNLKMEMNSDLIFDGGVYYTTNPLLH